MIFIKCFVVGIISVFLTYLLFLDFYVTEGIEVLSVIGMIFFTLLLCIGFCGFILFPISLFEKDRQTTLEIAFGRYLPFLTLPLFIGFCMVFFCKGNFGKHELFMYYFFLKAFIIAYCIGTTGLWTYLKNKRS